MTEVLLHPGRDRSLRRRHPWVLSGAVAAVEGPAEPGVWVRVRSAEGEYLGHGHLSPHSQIRVRMVAFGKEPPPADWLEARIRAAVERRRALPLGDTDALRLVNAEGDGLPGLVVDRYADVVVVRASAAGMLARREEVSAAVRAATGAPVGVERADPAARREGLEGRAGALWGALPEVPVTVRERGVGFAVDVSGGQKTGFYLDQRDARALVATLAPGRRVLDLFAYTGGFAVAALAAGAAHATLVESSREALALASRNLEANGVTARASLAAEDAFRHLRGSDARYDLVVVDPPPLARRRGDVARATRAYKDLVLHALRHLEPEGMALVFACSHHVGPELFRKVVFGASLDAQRPVQVLGEFGAPADHPVSLDHPEGRYLSGLWLRRA